MRLGGRDMILGTGIDIIEIRRIEKVFDSEKKKMRIFTEREIEEADPNNISRLSGFYASKEAFAKALGTGIRGIAFRDIEVLKDKAGKPYINKEKVSPLVKEIFQVANFTIHLTISHDREKAIAMVILEEGVK